MAFSKNKGLAAVAGGQTSKPFRYTAVSSSGERTKNTMVAPSAGAVVAALQREGWVPIEVEESKGQAMNVDVFAFITGGGVKLKWGARAEFARRMHQMLRAGISTNKALLSLAEDAPGPTANMCIDIAEKVMSGVPLADAMAAHPRAFDAVTVSYIRSGEESGTLIETTERLAVMLQKRASLQSKIKGVSAYPKLVGSAITVLTFGIITFLVPMYAKIYASFGAKLPAPTLALIWFSKHFLPIGIGHGQLGPLPMFYPTLYPLHVMSIILYLVIGWMVFKRKTKDSLEVGRNLDRIKFKLPLFGKLGHKSSLQRWAMTLAGGLASGVPMTRAIDLAAQSAGSRWHLWVAPRLAEAVRTGRPISSELAKYPDLYPPNVRTMLSTGEETGETDAMLGSVAEALDSDIDAIVAGLSAKIEVALLLVLGLVVGGLMVVLYMPILNLATTVNNGLNKG